MAIKHVSEFENILRGLQLNVCPRIELMPVAQAASFGWSKTKPIVAAGEMGIDPVSESSF
jgi:hypothetical protein